MRIITMSAVMKWRNKKRRAFSLYPCHLNAVLSLYSETPADSWLVCCVASVSDNNRSESSIDFSVNPAVQFCLVFASNNRKSLVSTTPTRRVSMEIARSGFNKPELCSCPSSTCRTSWQGGVCHGTGVLLCCWLQLKVTLRRESPPSLKMMLKDCMAVIL